MSLVIIGNLLSKQRFTIKFDSCTLLSRLVEIRSFKIILSFI